jgi:hypothetical protein
MWGEATAGVRVGPVPVNCGDGVIEKADLACALGPAGRIDRAKERTAPTVKQGAIAQRAAARPGRSPVVEREDDC